MRHRGRPRIGLHIRQGLRRRHHDDGGHSSCRDCDGESCELHRCRMMASAVQHPDRAACADGCQSALQGSQKRTLLAVGTFPGPGKLLFRSPPPALGETGLEAGRVAACMRVTDGGRDRQVVLEGDPDGGQLLTDVDALDESMLARRSPAPLGHELLQVTSRRGELGFEFFSGHGRWLAARRCAAAPHTRPPFHPAPPQGAVHVTMAMVARPGLPTQTRHAGCHLAHANAAISRSLPVRC